MVQQVLGVHKSCLARLACSGRHRKEMWSHCFAHRTEYQSTYKLYLIHPPGWHFFEKWIVSQDKVEGSGGGGGASPFCAGATQKESIAG